MPDQIRAQAVSDDYQVEADAAAQVKADAASPAEQLIRFVRSPHEQAEDNQQLAFQTSQDIMQQATQSLVAQANLSSSSVMALLLR